MPRPCRVYIEAGKAWVFACALDWPGWCRRGRTEEAAVESLLAYAPRYQIAAGSGFAVGAVEVLGHVEGNATTDFGAPAAIGRWDEEPFTGEEARRQVAILEATWRVFDHVVDVAPPDLRKGPRGGGRDRNQIADHVREAERAYASRIGARIPPRTPWPEQRGALADALVTGAPGGKWPARYALRRVAWHVLDHAWEIEDRSA